MNKKGSTDGQIKMWLLAAVSAPLAHFSGCGWLTTLLLSAAVLPICVLPETGWQQVRKKWCAPEMVWFAAAAGILVRNSGAYWPSASSWSVPVVLLILAVWNAGSEKGARAGSVLGWILLGLFGALLLAGLSGIEIQWEVPNVKSWRPELVLALLIPALAGIWAENTRGIGAGTAIAAVGFSLLVQGILSPNVASRMPAPFYEMSRSLTTGEICWELPGAVAMTLAWYVLASVLINGACEMAGRCEIPPKQGRWIVFIAAGAATLVNTEQIAWIFPVISLVLWIIVPYVAKIKKVEKSS